MNVRTRLDLEDGSPEAQRRWAEHAQRVRENEEKLLAARKQQEERMAQPRKPRKI